MRACGCETERKRMCVRKRDQEHVSISVCDPIFKTSFLLSDRMSSDLFQRKLRRRSLDEKRIVKCIFLENVLSENDFFAKKEKTFFSENR